MHCANWQIVTLWFCGECHTILCSVTLLYGVSAYFYAVHFITLESRLSCFAVHFYISLMEVLLYVSLLCSSLHLYGLHCVMLLCGVSSCVWCILCHMVCYGMHCVTQLCVLYYVTLVCELSLYFYNVQHCISI